MALLYSLLFSDKFRDKLANSLNKCIIIEKKKKKKGRKGGKKKKTKATSCVSSRGNHHMGRSTGFQLRDLGLLPILQGSLCDVAQRGAFLLGLINL